MPFTQPSAGSGLTARFALLAGILLAPVIACAGVTDRARGSAPEPRDVPYPGMLLVHVDASDTGQGIFRVHETIPVQPGELTLLFPQWIPGNHKPSGPIELLAGLRISAGGTLLAWKRDEYDVYAFRVRVPQGSSEIEVNFQFLSGRGKGSAIQMTDKLLDLKWNTVSLYPAGHHARQIIVQPRVTFPAGWKFGTALEEAARAGDTVTFKPVSYDTLIDSPIYAGRNMRSVDLDPGAKHPVTLDMFADAPECLEITAGELQAHRNLVTQALKLFGSRHYAHYHFLFSLSDQLSRNGIEHQQSTEVGADRDYLTKWEDSAPDRALLAHEFTHSWNGKFRRPADLWTPNFNVPMGDSLLWVYEGQTEYWGFVLTARSGLWSPGQFRDALASVAASYDRNRPGFAWRTLEDTTNDPTAARRGALPYRSWQMSEEYYSGGQMIWMAVDAKIRAASGGRQSLDGFAREFFGVDDGSLVPRTYTFDDVVSALNGVAKYDWASFLHRFVDALEPPFLEGLEASGWKLVYTDEPSALEKLSDSRPESPRFITNFVYSIGLALTREGGINDVRWNGPAFRAGISTGGTLVAVNGRAYSPEVLKHAITAAKSSKAPIDLLVRYQDDFRTVPVDYHDGLQYPHLVRIEGTKDYLSEVIRPK
ncbi:MAG: M61 family metallopeptidase [Proteobacteria bacterium]|nr:M61 family metallopeptidase [Pseudomonadota bacterium]